MRKLFAFAATAACLAMQPAQSAVVDGLVTTGAGSFEQIVNTAGLMVGENNQQSSNLFAFNETQSFELAADLETDIGGTISAGTVVSSHYVFFDPELIESQEGYVDFDGDIIGIITSRDLLLDSDFLGLAEVDYLSPLERGLEADDSVGIDGRFLSRLLVDWAAGTPGDYIRVITGTEITVIPVPASGLLLVGGLGMFAVARRRRRKS